MSDDIEPSEEASKSAVWDAIWLWLKAEGYERKLEALVKVNDALDRFRAAGVREVEVENEWLRRLLRWCRPRLRHGSYQAWLDKYLALGPSPAPEDEPPLVHSEPHHD